MRLSTFKDLLVVVSLLAGVAFAGTSVVQAVGAPVNDNAPTTAESACTPSSSVMSVAADAPDPVSAPELQC